ncbi:phosphatase PAP2 family protein [Microbacterium abyssi]|uniref:phosphatase PAP2 family protein n=1 Tax=Microbacterium abyssi TaxID=2782166 RepID=UPI0018899903|nr:phosphatase PAP2 family protein [Microbacterium sp. A18JL241]
MTRPVLLWWGIGAILAAMALGAALTAEGPDIPSAIDAWWNSLMDGIRSPFFVGFGSALDRVGGSRIATIVGLVAVAVLLIVRRWRAAVFVAVSLLASVLVVQLLKGLFGRTRPEDILVDSDFGSFPSGHTANATTFAVLAVMLFPRLWVWLVAGLWIVCMAFSRTVLSAHWLSDTVGGMLIGAGVTLVVGGLLLDWVRSTSSSPPRTADDASSA